jgi:hypothetical protein
MVPTAKRQLARRPLDRAARFLPDGRCSIAAILLSSFLLPGLLQADEPTKVDVRAATHAGFGRLVFQAVGPLRAEADASQTGVLLRFDRPVEADLAGVSERLAGYLLAIVTGGSAEELILAMPPGVHAEVAQLDARTVVVELAERPAAVAQVGLRTGRHPGFERIVLEWAEPVRISAQRSGSRIAIDFDRRGGIDADALLQRLPAMLLAARTFFGQASSRLELDLPPGVRANVFMQDADLVVIDLIYGDGLALPLPPPARPEGADAIATVPGGADDMRVAAFVDVPSAAAGARRSQLRPNRTGTSLLERIAAGQAGPAAPAAGGATAAEELDPELRALDRVLVEAGGLLLPTWGVEVSPSLEYTHRGANGLLITDIDGVRRVVAQDVKRDTVTAALTFRLGLPWDLQTELRLPYVIDQERVSMGGVRTEDSSGHGLGDLELALTHQLVYETGLLPDLLAELRWRAPTGKDSFSADPDELPVGSGFHGIGGSLTAVKSYDPLVFFGSLSYRANLSAEKRGFDVNPGNEVGFAIGTILSAGPGTSLRLGLSHSMRSEAEVNGQEIAGSDEVSSIFQVGAAAALPWRTLLDVSAGIGITEDAPDLTLRVSLPYRF